MIESVGLDDLIRCVGELVRKIGVDVPDKTELGPVAQARLEEWRRVYTLLTKGDRQSFCRVFKVTIVTDDIREVEMVGLAPIDTDNNCVKALVHLLNTEGTQLLAHMLRAKNQLRNPTKQGS